MARIYTLKNWGKHHGQRIITEVSYVLQLETSSLFTTLNTSLRR